ncbi:MAG: lipid II flippase MurJ, partial [Patescibacteria group bacterium]
MKLPNLFRTDLINIHHAAFWLAFFSCISAILGLFRDRMLASIFGAGRSLDIYYSAFRIPDFLYTLMLFFAASTVIIPIFLTDYKDNKQNAEKLFGSVLFFFFIVIFILGLAAFIFMKIFMNRFLPGFSTNELEQAVLLSRIMLLSPLFLGLSNILSSITQAFRRFFIYALSPVLYNIGIIIGILFFLPRFGLAGL